MKSDVYDVFCSNSPVIFADAAKVSVPMTGPRSCVRRIRTGYAQIRPQAQPRLASRPTHSASRPRAESAAILLFKHQCNDVAATTLKLAMIFFELIESIRYIVEFAAGAAGSTCP